jgi:hypothetical protein
METKQTSVEQLMWKLWDTPKDKFTWHAIMKQYNEIHKQEIIKAAARGYLAMAERFNLEEAKEYGQEYYDNIFDIRLISDKNKKSPPPPPDRILKEGELPKPPKSYKK